MQNFDAWRRGGALGFACCWILALTASAQTPTLESRLREALLRTTTDLHALQDQNEAMAGELAKAKADAAALAQTNSELKAKLDAVQPTQHAAPPIANPASDAALVQLRAELSAANARSAALQNQAAAGDAAARLRVNEAQTQAAAAAKTLATAQGLVRACYQTNQQLVSVATDILNTYKSETFRGVWLRSYDPVLGLDRVKLQNIMQDFEDRLLDHRLPPNSP